MPHAARAALTRRLSSTARLALGLSMLALGGCAGDAIAPPALRTLLAVSADGRPLPAQAACPAPFGEGSEAWVAVGEGTLTLEPSGRTAGRFTLHLAVGRGYRTVVIGPNGTPQYPAQYAEGRTFTVEGTYAPGASGDPLLYARSATASDDPELHEGRLVGDEAVVRLRFACPQAAAGSVSPDFRLTFRPPA